MTPQLKADFWTSALIRRAESAGAFAAVVKRGDKDAGACLVKVRLLNGEAVLYRPIRNMSGELVWLPKGPVNEREIDIYVNGRVDDDPDLWIVEIEDRQGRHFLTEPVEAAP